MNKSKDKIDEGVTEDDINEIKQDVSSFRYELLEVLRNNGMDIPDHSKKSNNIGSKRHKRREVGRKLSFGYCVTSQGTPKPRLSLIAAQADSFNSSIDDSAGETSGREDNAEHRHHHRSHHIRLARSKLGQIVMKKFHMHKSREIDETEISDMELSGSKTTLNRGVTFTIETQSKTDSETNLAKPLLRRSSETPSNVTY